MNFYKEKIDLVKQSINDVKYIKSSNHKETLGVIRVLSFWLTFYFVISFINCIVYEFNISCEFYNYSFSFPVFKLYNYSFFYPIYNLWRVIAFTSLPIVTYFYICRIRMSVQERRFIKTWIIYPVLMSLIQLMPLIASCFDINETVSFYNSVPISLIIYLISLFYIYSYCQYREIYILIFINIAYIIFSYIYIMVYTKLVTTTEIQVIIFNIVDYFKVYDVVEMLLTLILIFIMQRRRNNNVKVNEFI